MEASKGGLMGYFEKGQLPKDMENVVFSLRTNTISQVVKSHYGYHIFKVGKKKKRRLLYYKIVKPEIKKKLMSQKLRLAYQSFLKKTTQNLNIKINQNNLTFTYQKSSIKGDEVKRTSGFIFCKSVSILRAYALKT